MKAAIDRITEQLFPTGYRSNKDNKKKDTKELDGEFWCNCSVISHLRYMDTHGNIRLADAQGVYRSLQRTGDVAVDGEHNGETAIAVAGYPDGDGDEEAEGLNL